jgi:DNA-binding transcriptional LysR family regulator
MTRIARVCAFTITLALIYRLSLTQPAVSGMLNRLRESFGDPLFVRAQRGIVPTLRAEQLAAPVRQLLADVEALLQPEGFDPLNANLTLNLASTDYALRAVVVPFLRALRVQAPNIRIAVQPVDDEQLASQMDRGDIDLALITPETTPTGLHAAPLFDERYVCVMRTGHPDARDDLTGSLLRRGSRIGFAFGWRISRRYKHRTRTHWPDTSSHFIRDQLLDSSGTPDPQRPDCRGTPALGA